MHVGGRERSLLSLGNVGPQPCHSGPSTQLSPGSRESHKRREKRRCVRAHDDTHAHVQTPPWDTDTHVPRGRKNGHTLPYVPHTPPLQARILASELPLWVGGIPCTNSQDGGQCSCSCHELGCPCCWQSMDRPISSV